MFSLKMTLKEWLKYEMPINEIIVNASIKDGSDSFLPFMIGIDARCKLDYLIKLFEDVNSGNINNKLYCQAFSINTDLKRRGRWGRNEQPIRRETIFSSLTEKGFSDLYDLCRAAFRRVFVYPWVSSFTVCLPFIVILVYASGTITDYTLTLYPGFTQWD